MFSSRHIEVVRSSSKNDCGPCAVAMVLGAFEGKRVTAREAAREMRFWRVPGIGATLPRGITSTLRRHGLKTAGGWFGRIQDIKAHVDADHPVIVLTRPTDLPHAPFFSLHYRVVVGYNDNAAASGGGELYFSCSASPPEVEEHPGNLALSYAQFRRQWLTWVSINWYVAAYPR